VGTKDVARYRRRSGIEVIEIESEISIFNGEDRTLMLNETASAIWRLLEHEHTAADIADQLAPLYGTTAEAIRPDIETTLADLLRLGVLEEQQPSSEQQTAAPQ
jgi:hypothetical protein